MARITNIVVTCNVHCSIHLPRIVSRYPFCEWNKKKFAALTLRFSAPKTTCLIFASGRIVCTGGNSMHAVRLALLQASVMIRDAGYPAATVNAFVVQNIASSFAFPHDALDLEALFCEHPAQTSYEPELFPALVFRPQVKGVVYLIFESGRVVITGSRSVEQVHEAYEAMMAVLLRSTRCKRARTALTSKTKFLEGRDQDVVHNEGNAAVNHNSAVGRRAGVDEHHRDAPHPA